MDDEQDFYATLGVPRNASEAEIRKAFRGRAKELHPDRKAATDHEAVHSDEFRLLTEAYDTLKDPMRRKAYDEELTRGRQVAARGNEKPRYAFAKGLAIGLFIAIAAVGGKIYSDRAAFKFDASKNQDSLRVSSGEQIPISETHKSQSSKAERLDMAKQERLPDSRATGILGDGGAPETPQQSGVAPASVEAVSTLQPPGQTGQGQAASGVSGVAVTSAEPPSAIGSSRLSASQGQTGQDQTGLSSPGAQTRRTEAPPSAFSGEVLSLEGALDSGNSSVAAHQLVSLVNSATAINELVEAASLARKPETQDLISTRIAALRGEKRKPTPASEQDHAVSADNAVNGNARFKPGSIEIAVGPAARETAVRLTPGNGLSESFSDCSSCPEMVVIPAGQAIMGSRPESPGFRPEEAPAHRIVVKKPVAISKHWITAGDWRSCVEAGVCRPTISSFLAAGPEVPATRVSWFDAKAYVDWLSQATGRRYRLLSETEWEYAAQAQGRYPSAAPLKPEAAGPKNANDFGVFRYGAKAKRFGSTRPNAWGLYALPGNALEWVEDCWHPNYFQAPAETNPWLAGAGGDCAYRVVRGGAPAGEIEERRAVARAREFADARAPTLTFRVAREVAQPAKTALDSSTTGGRSVRGD